MIDLRSDTVTRPTRAMRQAMAEAEVGDDVYGEDPTINRLEAMAAERFGHEAALFVPSGTQANLTALMSHCQRGDEYVVGQDAHCYRYEGGGAAVLGSIQPQPLPFEDDGCLDLDKVRAVVKPGDNHYARTRLLAVENTVHGKALPLDYLPRARALVDEHGLGLHLDGARIFNAAVFHGVAVHTLTQHVDSVSACLSKALGAPVGSVLSGSRDFIARARRWRKLLGGGMRQAGILAAACIHALEHHVERLAEDHENATRLRQGLQDIDELDVRRDERPTNMVWATLSREHNERLPAFLQERGIMVGAFGDTVRMVTHLDVSAADIDTTVAAFKAFFAG